MARGKHVHLIAPIGEQWIGGDEKCIDTPAHEPSKRRVDLALVAGILDLNLLPERARRRLDVQGFRCGIRIGRITKKPDRRRAGQQRAQQFQPLWSRGVIHPAYAGDIAAGPIVARYQAELDGIAAGGEDDWNGGRCSLGRKDRGGATGRCDHCHLTADQIGRERRQPVIVTLSPAILDRYRATFDVASFASRPCRKAAT